MRLLSLLSCLLLLLIACNTAPEVEPAPESPTPVDPAATPSAAATETDLSEAIANNDRPAILADGYWQIVFVYQRQPTDRYQKMKDNYYRFESDGNYALLQLDGTPVHSGSWRYERRGNRQHYIYLDATNDAYNNIYRFHLQPKSAVLVGTEEADNGDLQMRLIKLPKPPTTPGKM